MPDDRKNRKKALNRAVWAIVALAVTGGTIGIIGAHLAQNGNFAGSRALIILGISMALAACALAITTELVEIHLRRADRNQDVPEQNPQEREPAG